MNHTSFILKIGLICCFIAFFSMANVFPVFAEATNGSAPVSSIVTPNSNINTNNHLDNDESAKHIHSTSDENEAFCDDDCNVDHDHHHQHDHPAHGESGQVCDDDCDVDHDHHHHHHDHSAHGEPGHVCDDHCGHDHAAEIAMNQPDTLEEKNKALKRNATYMSVFAIIFVGISTFLRRRKRL